MGGQACILYGAAEFSRDVDFAILASPGNIAQLRAALAELGAEVIAVPPFELKYLRRGHAVHFRASTPPEAAGLRIDVMTKMRGVDPFARLWSRRVTMEADDGTPYEVMSLPDLVQAKKTQRDKDWPMIRRLVEADYLNRRDDREAAVHNVRFWLRELRTPELLIDLVSANPAICRELKSVRPLLKFAAAGDAEALADALWQEERAEREADRIYWKPLREELEQLRRERASGSAGTGRRHVE